MSEKEMIGEAGECPGCGNEIDVPVKVDGVTYCLRCAAELRGQPAVPSEATGLELETETVMPGIEEPETDDEEVEEDEDEEETEEDEGEEETPVSNVVPSQDDETEDAGQEDPSHVVPSQDDEGKPNEKVSDILVDDAKEEVKSSIRLKKKKARDALVADPDSISERWRRARLIREGYVIFRTLSRDEKTGDFLLDTVLVKRSDLPTAAVAVTNEKNTYCLDTIKTSKWYQENRPKIEDPCEAQFTARDAYLHMKTNKYDNVMSVKWEESQKPDYKKFILPVVGGIAVLLIIMMLGAR